MMARQWKHFLVVALTLVLAILFSNKLLIGASAEQSRDFITLPRSLAVIGEEAFCNSTSIDTVIVPEGTTQIGSRAFAGSSIREIILPSTIESIAEDAFENTNLSTFTAQPGTFAYSWGYTHGYIESIFPESEHPYGAKGLLQTWEYVHPTEAYALKITFDSRTEIESGDTLCILYLDSWIIGEGRNLAGKTIAIEGNQFTIKLYSFVNSFYYGFKIVSIEAMSQQEYIDYMNTINYTNSNGTITSYEGGGVNGEIVIPSEINGQTVTAIGDWVFDGCCNITSVELPNGLLSIGNRAFDGCYNITSVKLSEDLESVGEYAFSGCSGLLCIDLPNDLTNIGRYAFSSCNSLTSIKIPDDMKCIEEGVFCNCSGITSVILPEGLTNIDYNAFSYCSSLTTIHLPSSLTFIGDTAFSGCPLTNVTAEPGTYAYSWLCEHGYL